MFPKATTRLPQRMWWVGVIGLLLAVGGDAAPTDNGWTVTVYYTAVETYHHRAATRILGCPRLDCAHGTDLLGMFPRDFAQAVHDEGTGRITEGGYAGRYLNWSYDVGYWIDDAPRDTDGRPLVPFQSAAADPDVLPAGTQVTIASCGTESDGSTVDSLVCDRLVRTRWRIVDEFTPGMGGRNHIDLYLGEETGPGFTDGPWYVTLIGARVRTSTT